MTGRNVIIRTINTCGDFPTVMKKVNNKTKG